MKCRLVKDIYNFYLKKKNTENKCWPVFTNMNHTIIDLNGGVWS